MSDLLPDMNDALILVVDNDTESNVDILSGMKEYSNLAVFENGEDALSFCRKRTPDLILLNVDVPNIDGLTICREIRAMSMLTRCPIIFMSSDKDFTLEVKGWEAGASDFLHKPIAVPALKMRIMSHLTSHWHIEIANRLHQTDSLTGLYNRYYFDKHIGVQIAYAKRYNSDLSLLIVDINQFKSFNELNGHSFGDQTIKRIAQGIKKVVSREPDCVCRYGGEEFAVILPGTNRIGANVVSQRINNVIQQMAIPFNLDQSGYVSVTIGRSSMNEAQDRSKTLFECADEDLQSNKARQSYQVA